MHSNTSIQRELAFCKLVAPIHSVASRKRSNSCYQYQITSRVKDRLSLHALKYVYSKATYRLSMSESDHFTVWQVGKRSKSCYHYQITSPVNDRVSLHVLRYLYSKATYPLSMNHTSSQCSKWGKGANHGTIIRSLHSSRIDYHYMHSNTYIQRQFTF